MTVQSENLQLFPIFTSWISKTTMLSSRTILLALYLLLPVSASTQTAVPESQTGNRTETVRQNSTGTAGQIWYDVSRVVDGDTFWVDDGSVKGMKVRLIGINAPEPRSTGSRPKAFFGTESTIYLQRLLEDKKVRLEYDILRHDRYGRTLAYAYLEDGTFINAHLVRNGYATVMTVPPNVKHQQTFTELAAKARRQNRGLWKGDPSAK